ncbi:hypothetical protein RRH01S_12_00930 [Rhizobium rhizogenes NBRC 13257]|uniref:Uncharacterized protein n=1 Tax=Rhizobium rhizogenes NBRC 13257 TaxID=1220581 RepID=A0AA87Q4S4_RHIRH|nr:hypothetical protein RRH01S_12_00930 [Rhizobium rhizogenes NBRC 13257]
MWFPESYILAAEARSAWIAGHNHCRGVEKTENIFFDNLRIDEFKLIFILESEGGERKSVFLGGISTAGLITEETKNTT